MRFRTAITAAALIGVLSACTGQTQMVRSPREAQTAAERVALALDAGSSSASAKSRVAAARTLAALGARPAVPGDPDLAASWSATTAAAARGADAEPVYRGRMLGPAYRKGSISAGAEVLIEQVFMAGQVAEVVLSPSGGAQLNLTIADPAGQEVCNSRILRPQGRCSWRPPFASRYRVRISNSGAQEANFFLVVN